MSAAIRWVGQEDTYGCGCASVAMLTGRTYADVRALVGRDLAHGGMSGTDWEELLGELGYATCRRTRFRHWVAVNLRRPEWPPVPFGQVHLCEVLAGNRGSHMVVMLADGRVLDPLTPVPRRLGEYADVYWVAAVVPLPPRDGDTL